jgi:hypothetical protein
VSQIKRNHVRYNVKEKNYERCEKIVCTIFGRIYKGQKQLAQRLTKISKQAFEEPSEIKGKRTMTNFIIKTSE